MVILELGIVHGGKSLVSKRLDEIFNTKFSAELRVGFLSCINDFIHEAFSQEIDSFTMKNLNIYLLSHQMENQQTSDEAGSKALITYCIGDKKLKKKSAQKTLRKVQEEFLKKYEDVEDFSGDESLFQEFGLELEKIMK